MCNMQNMSLRIGIKMAKAWPFLVCKIVGLKGTVIEYNDAQNTTEKDLKFEVKISMPDFQFLIH